MFSDEILTDVLSDFQVEWEVERMTKKIIDQSREEREANILKLFHKLNEEAVEIIIQYMHEPIKYRKDYYMKLIEISHMLSLHMDLLKYNYNGWLWVERLSRMYLDDNNYNTINMEESLLWIIVEYIINNYPNKMKFTKMPDLKPVMNRLFQLLKEFHSLIEDEEIDKAIIKLITINKFAIFYAEEFLYYKKYLERNNGENVKHPLIIINEINNSLKQYLSNNYNSEHKVCSYSINEFNKLFEL